MDEEVRKRLEYEEQFFGMSSQFFSDCCEYRGVRAIDCLQYCTTFKKLIMDELDTKITTLVENFRGKLVDQSKNPERFEVGVQKMKENLTTAYRTALEKSFPEIESKISNFINIPPNVLLKEDLPVKAGINANLSEIREEIENLKGTFSSLLYLKQKMLEELEEADSAIFFMECMIKGEKFDFNVMPVEEISELSKANNYLVNES